MLSTSKGCNEAYCLFLVVPMLKKQNKQLVTDLQKVTDLFVGKRQLAVLQSWCMWRFQILLNMFEIVVKMELTVR